MADATSVRPDTATAPVPRWRRPQWRAALIAATVAVLLGQMVTLLCLSVSDASPTSDEVTYAAAAAAYVRWNDLDVNIEHPPLAKIIAGMPLRITGVQVKEPTDTLVRSQRQYGWLVLYKWGNSPHRLIWLLRLPEIILTALFGLMVFFFARDLWGNASGLLALGVFSVTPSVLAHGGLATNDMVVAGFLVASLWMAWRARGRPRVYLPLTGVALGLAMATKATAFAMVPLVVLIVGVDLWRRSTGGHRRRAAWGIGAMAAVTAAALATLWAVYLFVDPRLRVDNAHPLGGPVSPLRESVVNLLPIPHPYKVGLLYQFALETWTFPVTMFGHDFPQGTRLFLPAALIVKSPIPLLVLGVAGLLMMVLRRQRAVAFYVLLPAAWSFITTVIMTARPFGNRYLLPVILLLCVASGAVLDRTLPVVRRVRLAQAGALALAVAMACGSFMTFPYYLTYSNIAFGGSTRTSEVFPQDVDWDQDLRRTADYLHRHNITGPIYWMEHGGQPGAYGVDAVTPKSADQVEGMLVVFTARLGFTDHPRLRDLRPIAVIGNAVFIYDVPPSATSTPASAVPREDR